MLSSTDSRRKVYTHIYIHSLMKTAQSRVSICPLVHNLYFQTENIDWKQEGERCKPTPIPTAAPALDSHLSATLSQANTAGETAASNEAAKLCELKIHESCPLCMTLPHYVRHVGSKQVDTTRIKQNLYEYIYITHNRSNDTGCLCGKTSHGVNKRLRQHLMYRVN